MAQLITCGMSWFFFVEGFLTFDGRFLDKCLRCPRVVEETFSEKTLAKDGKNNSKTWTFLPSNRR